jgi:hypothetical protein
MERAGRELFGKGGNLVVHRWDKGKIASCGVTYAFSENCGSSYGDRGSAAGCER